MSVHPFQNNHRHVIRLRDIRESRVAEFRVSGARPEIVDIPPGRTHTIENAGTTDLLTLFWADEIYDPARPDTHFAEVSDDEA